MSPLGPKSRLTQSTTATPRAETAASKPPLAPAAPALTGGADAELRRKQKERETIQQYISRRETELRHKITWLQTHLPDDELQRKQSQAIIELFEMVKNVWESEAVLASMLPENPRP